MGLREQKKQKTRKSISDLATQLFIDRGYNEVTTAEIAELSEVSIPTLFKYFPTKESLVFDEDQEIESWLINSVKNRNKNQSILDALLLAGIEMLDATPDEHKKNHKKFMNLVDNTPELALYAKQMWMRHEKAFAQAILKESKNKLSKLESESIARFILDSYHRSIRSHNSKAALKEMFNILKVGWRE